MINTERQASADDTRATAEALFEHIAHDLEIQGYSIQPTGLPMTMAISLQVHQQAMRAELFTPAGIGRGDAYLKNERVRTDEICWITGESTPGKQWLHWAGDLQAFLNRRLFLGLFSFESHFAHYRPGDYYKKHYDAFKGETNRRLSIVAYLNPEWTSADGGELVLYQHDSASTGINVLPLMGTVVIFLSEEFPHEVLPATRDRYSIAGWFRVNASLSSRADPPL